MVLRALFFTCMFSALHQSWGVDLTVLLGALLFPHSWRSFLKDLQVVVTAVVLLCLLVRFEHWRYWYPVILPVEFSTAVEQLTNAIGRRIQWASNAQYGGFLKAVLLADKSDLPASTLDVFRDLGISHVLAVSGFHIGFWVMLLRPLFSWVRSPRGKVVAHICQCMLLFVYSQMVGASPSVLRAVWMYSLARLAILQQWRIPSLHFPMIVAIGHYFVNPAAPRSLSFQLSYTAVFAILLALRKQKGEQLILHYSYRRIRKKGSWLFVPLQISLAAWSATLPIVQGAFGGSSPYFLAGNLLVVPLITIMIWACIPLLVFASLLPQEVLDLYETVWLSLMSAADYLLFVLKELG
jgi:competence protein ComEC